MWQCPLPHFVRNRPEDVGALPDGEPLRRASTATNDSAESESTDAIELSPRQALKTLSFWVIAVARLTSVVSIVTLSVHLVPKLTDSGISLITANFVVTLYTFVAFLSGFVAGYLADRTSKIWVLFVCMLMQALAMAILTVTDGLPMAMVFAVLWGAGFGGRVPLLTAIIGDFFGRRNFGSILGLNMVPSNIAMIFAPLIRRLHVRPEAKLLHTICHLHRDGIHRSLRNSAGKDAERASAEYLRRPCIRTAFKLPGMRASCQIYSWRRRGSTRSRIQSPKSVKAITVSAIASPGISVTHQAVVRRGEATRGRH